MIHISEALAKDPRGLAAIINTIIDCVRDTRVKVERLEKSCSPASPAPSDASSAGQGGTSTTTSAAGSAPRAAPIPASAAASGRDILHPGVRRFIEAQAAASGGEGWRERLDKMFEGHGLYKGFRFLELVTFIESALAEEKGKRCESPSSGPSSPPSNSTPSSCSASPSPSSPSRSESSSHPDRPAWLPREIAAQCKPGEKIFTQQDVDGWAARTVPSGFAKRAGDTEWIKTDPFTEQQCLDFGFVLEYTIPTATCDGSGLYCDGKGSLYRPEGPFKQGDCPGCPACDKADDAEGVARKEYTAVNSCGLYIQTDGRMSFNIQEAEWYATADIPHKLASMHNGRVESRVVRDDRRSTP